MCNGRWRGWPREITARRSSPTRPSIVSKQPNGASSSCAGKRSPARRSRSIEGGAMTVLMGYADKVSVAPGETIGFKVSCAGAVRYRADIVRVLSPEAGPEAPPFRSERVESPVNGDYPAREQKLRSGSWAMVPAHRAVAALESFSLQAYIWPTLADHGRQAIMGTWSETLACGFGLMLDASGALELRLGGGKGDVTVLASGVPLLTRKWYFVAASFDAGSGIVRLHQELLADKTMAHRAPIEKQAAAEGKLKAGPGPFLFAAWHAGEHGDWPLTGGHFNRKIYPPPPAHRPLRRAPMAPRPRRGAA